MIGLDHDGIGESDKVTFLQCADYYYYHLSLSARFGLLLAVCTPVLPISMIGGQNKEMPLLVSVLIDITTFD